MWQHHILSLLQSFINLYFCHIHESFGIPSKDFLEIYGEKYESFIPVICLHEGLAIDPLKKLMQQNQSLIVHKTISCVLLDGWFFDVLFHV